jgi:hypothetical protein
LGGLGAAHPWQLESMTISSINTLRIFFLPSQPKAFAALLSSGKAQRLSALVMRGKGIGVAWVCINNTYTLSNYLVTSSINRSKPLHGTILHPVTPMHVQALKRSHRCANKTNTHNHQILDRTRGSGV